MKNHFFWWLKTAATSKFNVWVGIVDNRIVRSIFFRNIKRRTLLRLPPVLIAAFLVLHPNPQDPNIPNNDIWFHQDEAPPHFANNVTFPNTWIGRRCLNEWPPKSPDITQLDFFLWDYLNSKLYVNRPGNLDGLKQSIRQETRLIGSQVIGNVQLET